MIRFTLLTLSRRTERCSFRFAGRSLVAGAFLFSVFGASSASAALFSFAGTSSDTHPVSGSADFTLNAAADTVTVKLTNTTATTNDAGELLTGIDFSLGGLTPTMTSDTGAQRMVDGAGSPVDSGVADLSWSLVALGGGNFQLNFTPNAKDSIIGPPTAGSYSGANGSIKGNAAHNPFAAEMAVFELSVPGLEADTAVDVTVFRYGTTLDPAVPPPGGGIPEPSTVILLSVASALFAFGRRNGR